jgi:hypothetical protein
MLAYDTAWKMIEPPSPSMTNENTAPPPTTISPPRRYDKGERRFKHVGSGNDPIIEFSKVNPRIWIGKCPATLVSVREQLESLESLMIRWCQQDSQGLPDVDAGKPCPV